MDFESFLEMLVTPPTDHQPSAGAFPHGQGPEKYTWFDERGRAGELLKGDLVALPGPQFLEGVNFLSTDVALEEIRKAWVGGFVSGHTWCQIKTEWLLNQFLENPDRTLLTRLAELDWQSQPRDRETLLWLAYNARRLLDHELGDSEENR